MDGTGGQESTCATPTHHQETETLTLQPEACPLTAALSVIGGKWNLIVLYWLAADTQRFTDLQRLMPAITHKVLTAVLRQLECEELVVRRVYPQVPPKVEYQLSEHGRSVLPIVEQLRLHNIPVPLGLAHVRGQPLGELLRVGDRALAEPKMLTDLRPVILGCPAGPARRGRTSAICRISSPTRTRAARARPVH